MTRPARLLRRACAGIATAVATTAVVGSTLAPAAPPAADGAAADLVPVAAPTAPPTTFNVATFNLLGFSHTSPTGDRTGYESGTKRMVYATQIIARQGLDLVGFQEMEGRQYDKFLSLTGGTWDTWPGRNVKDGTYSSVAWRTDQWTAVDKRVYNTPYFYGKSRPRPLVQLRNNITGQLIWFTNTHNPSNVRGDAQAWRDESERIQAATINAVRAANPTIPVVFTGDMNDRERFYCPVTYLTDLESASGGYHEDVPGGACQPAAPVQIDWIMGTPDIGWSNYAAVRDDLVKAATDHPVVVATGTIAAQRARAAGVSRVVVIDVQGLRSGAVTPRTAPVISSLAGQGAATLDARPNSKPTKALPGTISLLTGRPVGRAGGGHGVGSSRDKGSTVHKAAKQYVSSIFDDAHNLGVRTAFYTGDRNSAIVPRTWDTKAAGTDTWGANNGRAKITSRLSGTDRAVAAVTRRKLAAGVGGVTIAQLNDVDEAGRTRGWTSKAYIAAVRKADKRVAGIVATIRRNPALAASTMIVITSSSRGAPAKYGFGVPFITLGPGIEPADLYALNPAYVRPGAASTSANPIRITDIANLVADALSLPTVPRSRGNTGRMLDVFGS